ncbi:MAG: hypothetical protein U9Q84_01375 [Thermodesulfobacteriota bacterium]|nr:hypothetical protein [Thermodesulfobacteriota bacterium]
MQKSIKYLVAFFVILVLAALVIYSSFSNMKNYYIKATDGAVEIRQGKFAPMSRGLFITLPGAQAPQSIKEVYSKEEVFPFIFNYYINRADALLDIPGMPDFDGIKFYLNKAIFFGTTDDLRKKAYARLNSIDMMILQYKADVAVSRETVDGFKTALEYLNKAALLDLDTDQKKLINQKIKSITAKIAESIASHPKTPAATPFVK